MPGQVVATAVRRLARDTCGLDVFLEYWADGGNVAQLAEGIGVGAPWLRTWFKKFARKISEKTGDDYYAMRAEALQEQSLDDAENVAADRDEIQKAKLVIEQRNRIAAALDPKTWGEKSTGATVQVISNGQLALVALSTVAKESLPAPRAALPPGGNEEKHDGPEKAA